MVENAKKLLITQKNTKNFKKYMRELKLQISNGNAKGGADEYRPRR